MYRAAIVLFCGLLTSCAGVAPDYQNIQGGTTVNQPGVTFVLPSRHMWAVVMRSTYQSVFGAFGIPKNDTLIVSTSVYNIKPPATKNEFLKVVHDGRANEPDTGRFESIKNSEQLYEGRSETCAVYRSASKDFGVKAKRGGPYSVFEVIGMHCVHPAKPNVGVQVELSRKAPPDTAYPDFESAGMTLLESVTFNAF